MKKVNLGKKAFVASVDVHAQNTFTPICPDELPVPEGTSIVPQLNAQAKFAKYRIGSKEAHNPNAMWIANHDHPQLTPVEGENVDVRWVPHSIVGSKGFELIDGLPQITDYDYFVWEGIELDMHPYGVCYHDHQEKLSTGLIEFLQNQQVTTVIVGGLATDYCVKVTTLQLLKAGFKTILNLAACRGLAEETTESAIKEMQQQGAIIVESAEQLSVED